MVLILDFFWCFKSHLFGCIRSERVGERPRYIIIINDDENCVTLFDIDPYFNRYYFPVCKEWLVHEDGALAYHLQKLEG